LEAGAWAIPTPPYFMKIKYLKTETLKQKLEELRTPQAKTETRPAKGDESGSLYARHIAEELARRNK